MSTDEKESEGNPTSPTPTLEAAPAPVVETIEPATKTDGESSTDTKASSASTPPASTSENKVEDSGITVYKASTSKLFIGGISWETTDNGFYKCFETFGPVKEAYIMRDMNGSSRGFGFVTFESEAVAENVVNVSRQVYLVCSLSACAPWLAILSRLCVWCVCV